jgi:hypothetical protein
MTSKFSEEKLLIIVTCLSNYYKLVPNIFQEDDEFHEIFQEFIGCCS